MRKKFFFQNVLLFLIPLLIPTIVLGSLSIISTNRYTDGEINKNNTLTFHQMERNMELIFNEIDALGVSFGNSEVLTRLEEIFRTQKVTLENKRLIQAIQNYIDAPANSRPYIESIYVYVNNHYNQFLASGTGLTNFSQFHDVSWIDSFRAQEDKLARIKIEERQIRHYSFESPIEVTTIYKPLYSTLMNQAYGVIVLNIYSDYIDKQLQTFATYAGQYLLVLDEHGQIRFHNQPLKEFTAADLAHVEPGSGSFVLKKDGTSYIGSQLLSTQYEGWRYISLVPEHSLNHISYRLSKYTIYVVLTSFLLGLLVTLFLTNRSLQHIRKMISIIKSAERGLPLPPIQQQHHQNEYNFIIQTMIKNFIEQNYLHIQLSEKKYKLQATELLALQSQMNPHFLFNTLETINWKVIRLTGRPNEANHMLEHLSDLLRYSLDTPGRIVPIRKEVNYTKSYIEIQKYRYEDKFDVIWDYDEEEVEVYGVVKLVLQPLVENSLYHGIKEKAGRGLIKIKIDKHPSFIRISVIDNGVGMSKKQLYEVRDRMNQDTDAADHVGLANTNKRIKLSYQSDESLRILSKPGFGTVVSLRIPCG